MNTVIAVVMIAILLSLGFITVKAIEKLEEGSLINIDLGDTNIDVPTTNLPTQEGDSSRIDLCRAYQPIYVAIVANGFPHPQTTCTAGGGSWVCDENHAGCYDYMTPINCSKAVYSASIFICDSYGASGFCDANNAYCQYP